MWKSNVLLRNTPNVPRKSQILFKEIQISPEAQGKQMFSSGKLERVLREKLRLTSGRLSSSA